METPAYWNKDHFKPGQLVKFGEFDAVTVRHYYEGMWEIRVPGDVTCFSGADLIAV